MTAAKYVGRPIGRLEDAPLVEGRGLFVDDMHLPGMLEAAFVRSPHAHAAIKGVDVSAALALDGVHAVLTLDDLRPLLTRERLPEQFINAALAPEVRPFVLAKNEVIFVGEALAVVVADSRYVAEDAAALVAVDYMPMPIVADCRLSIESGAPRVDTRQPSNIVAEFRQHYGDVNEAFARATHRLAMSLKQHRGVAQPIEGRGLLASYDANEDRITVWNSTQMAHEVRRFLMLMLGIDEHQIRVLAPDVGGGFGSKFIMYPEEVAIVAASRKLGRPLKWIEDRREHFFAAIQERDQYWDFEVAFDGEGRLHGVRGRMINDQGAYTPQDINMPYNASTAFPGPYMLPAYDLHVLAVATNKVATAPVRGAGYPQGTFAMERTLDRIAQALGLDRAEVRQRNLVPADRMPYVTPLKSRSGSSVTYDSGDFHLCQQKALDVIGYATFSERQSRARAAGHYTGMGLANGVKGTGRGPFESAIVRVDRSGRICVYTGAMAMGQGIRTALAQICAEQFGVDPAEIRVVLGDTATISMGLGGFASRQTVTAGSAVHLAALVVREKTLKVASHLLETATDDLELRDGRVQLRGVPGYGIALRDVAAAVGGIPGYSLPGGIEPGLENMQSFVPKALTYGMGCHAVEAEVDIGTGGVRILRYVVVHDCGRVINPMIVEGQIVGGVVHGIGNSLFERMGYDQQAQPTTTTLAEYLLPTAPDVPAIEVSFVEFPSPLNPLGVKGVGEVGCVPATAAVISAIENALEPFGVKINEAPISPEGIFELIRNAQTGVSRNA